MESPILNLQERLQKLIDQYTADKKGDGRAEEKTALSSAKKTCSSLLRWKNMPN